MLPILTVLSSGSGFDFSNSNSNYDNRNSNVSSHLCEFICSINPALMAKNKEYFKSVGILQLEAKTI